MKELSAIKSANQMAWENAVLCVHATLQAWAWGIAETAAKKKTKKKKEKKERKKNYSMRGSRITNNKAISISV